MSEQPPALPDLRELAEAIRAFDDKIAQQQAINEALHEKVAWYSGELARKNEELTASLAETSSLKNYLADLIEHDTDGVLAIDLDRRVTACNAVAADLFHALDPAAPDERPLGRFILEALPRSCRPIGDLLLRAMDEKRPILNLEFTVPLADGSVRILSASASPVHSGAEADPRSVPAAAAGRPEAAADPLSPASRAAAEAAPPSRGRLSGAVGTLRDLTHYKSLEERVQRNERLAALGEMAAGVAHEIRNPLGGIELFASNLRRKLPEGSAERTTCDKIIAAATHLNRIVSDLLTFTRAREPARRPVSAEMPVRIALDLAADRVDRKSVRLAVDASAAPGKYRLDPDLLGQAFLNVVQNACDAVSQGGSLNITAAERMDAEGRRVLEYVFADDGPGVPESARDKLFNPFFTLRRDGTGLGLAIVHRIAQDHGGVVVIGDNQPRGATFTFTLPIVGDRP